MRKIKTKKTMAEKSEAKPVKIAKKTKTEKKAAAEDFINIDFPTNNEEIPIGTGYTIRISASQCETVQISVNDGDWMECRNASGYWWFDWDEIEPGRYKIYARMKKTDGTEAVSKRRLCKIA